MMADVDIAMDGHFMKADRITIKVGNTYYIKAKYEIEDALNKLGRLEDEEDTKATNNSHDTKPHK